MFLYCRYLVCLNGLEAIQCPQNFGSFLRFFPCIQVCTMFVYNFYLNLSPLLEAFTTEVLPYFIFYVHNKTCNVLNFYFTNSLSIALSLKCSQNVVLLLDGVHAHVIPIWEKVCWPYYIPHSSIEERTLHKAI